ncbi:MAG: zinc metallopeptidase [Deltaproteobacteria bacterium]|nr:zinc metallopeptidase [Deltaproteobacteria bacterium]
MFDGNYLLLVLLPGLILGGWAQWRIKHNFHKFSKVASMRGLTGAQAARLMLDRAGLHNVGIEGISGKLTDHYDPRSRVLRLSPDVGNSNSLAAIGVACHEAGHALQHQAKYAPLEFRNALVPVVQLSSSLMWPLLIAGFLLGISGLFKAAVILFSFAVLFHIVTLPVEFDASSRAIKEMANDGILMEQEIGGARKVLNAAAMTYVASTIVAILNLLYYIALSRR